MEFVDFLLPETYRIAIGWTLLHSFWQIIIISLVLYLVLWTFNDRSASFKYRLGYAFLLLILTVSTITFIICLTESSSIPIESSVFLFLSNDEQIFLSPQTFNPPYWADKIGHILPLLVNIWLVGAVLFMFRLGSNFSVINNLRKNARISLSKEWLEFSGNQKLKIGIQRNVLLLSSKAIHGPITFGTFKPVILIPASLILHLSPAQLEAIITHELAHIKRYDYLLNIIQSAMEAIFFYHPCFWWINNYVREQREHACDDLAIKSGIAPKDLAYGLAEVLNHVQEPLPEMALGAGSQKHPTLKRIKRMLGLENQKTKFPSLISYTMIFSILISATVVLGANHIATQDNEAFVTEYHSYIEAPFLDLPAELIDTIVSPKKDVYIIHEEENSQSSRPDSIISRKNKMIIINGDTQRIHLPNKPIITLFKDSMLVNFPSIKIDSTMIIKLSENSLYVNGPKNLRPYMFDTAILDKAMIRKLELSAKEMEKYSKEMEAQVHVWTQKYHPKLEELQGKIKLKELQIFDSHESFAKDIAPQLKELEKKIEEWQKEFTPKMEEFHQKMEIWQNENTKQIEEMQKSLIKTIKKGDR
ncbi:M56 family metallopeptidase [Anditalea andensis]|uniref:Peptidase M56 domain-containing protein n=1 Tax=Anditalea andensis TaxID=1048983 RepID=A0A074KX36_9BACT|nr:M56 family metallopeptidase [Anditalea andensis]KEO72795.1 hypothetical protein EL17_14270 [Anditalea andensis]